MPMKVEVIVIDKVMDDIDIVVRMDVICWQGGVADGKIGVEFGGESQCALCCECETEEEGCRVDELNSVERNTADKFEDEGFRIESDVKEVEEHNTYCGLVTLPALFSSDSKRPGMNSACCSSSSN
ncbi:Hypothetical predicted protein [Octopus vulgaris]|uniref:Uncharacterized protein n=1 Tax=Octopus vulgaris TaxID=6645 RepID=A0AA36EXG8_OCTVU|nr:Hypothetical predicted protein [Octopus vulgaris]